MSDIPLESRGWLSRLDKLLTYDFCPWANRWVYWMKHPLAGMTVAAAAAGLCGLYVATQAWLLCAGLVLVGLLGLLWPMIALAGLKVNVHFEQAWCEEGQPLLVRVRVLNRLPCPVWGFSLAGGMPGEALLVSFSRVVGWKTTEFRWEFVPTQRGVYPNQPIFVETGFPFGVWTARKDVSADGEIVVLPRPVELDAIPEINTGLSFDESYSDRQAGESGDVTGTRPFREGDSLRRVHWALTARTTRLICCERQAVLHSSVVVSIDLQKQHHSSPGADSSLEWAIRIFAGICQELTQQGIRVTAILGTDSMNIQPGQQGLLRLMLRLARLPAEGLGPEKSSAKCSVQSDIRVMTSCSEPAVAAIQVLLELEGFKSQNRHSTSVHTPTTSAASRFASVDKPSPAGLGSQRISVQQSADIPHTFPQNWRRACRAAS